MNQSTVSSKSFLTQNFRWLLWLRTSALTACPLFYAAYHLRNSYFYFDEWDGFERSLHLRPWDAMKFSINGHIMILDYWIHRIQITVFGIDSHRFTIVLMLSALLVLNYALLLILRSFGVSGFTSLLIAAFFTYMGCGSQDFLFAAQISPLLAVATGILCVATVLKFQKSHLRGALVASGLLLSSLIDSGMATITIPAASLILWHCWSRKHLWCVFPAASFIGLWYLTADLSPHFDSSLTEKIRFAFHLLLGSVGAIVGAGEIAGLFIIFIVITIFVEGRKLDIFSARTKIVSLAFALSTILTTIAVSTSRSGMNGFTLSEANRYAHNIAIPFALMSAPIIVAATSHAKVCLPDIQTKFLWRISPAIFAFFCLAAAYPTFHLYASNFESTNVRVHQLVNESVQVIRQGCPVGTTLDTTSRPIGLLSPQVTTQLLFDLMTRDSLRGDDIIMPSQETIDIMCLPPS